MAAREPYSNIRFDIPLHTLGSHERLTRRIVPRIRLAAHADVDAVPLQQVRVIAAGM